MPAVVVDPIPESALLRPPHWPAGCGAVMSTRLGGVSAPPFDSMNLRGPPFVADDALAVAENRRRFAATIAAVPVYLEQVHGTRVVRLEPGHVEADAVTEKADASITTERGIACTVLVADCLPVLFASRDGRAVGAAHAGWRGLAGGVLEATVAALCTATGLQPRDFIAWIGAGIGPGQFEVGADVVAAFGPGEAAHFRAAEPRAGVPKWLTDLPALAQDRLRGLGLDDVSGCGLCTASDRARFFSYRRDGLTGRLAAAAWISAV
jgi:hypothetical protein